MKPNAIIINKADNVAIALTDIGQGESILLADDRNLTAFTDIACSHKILLEDIDAGEAIVKYGEIIGESEAPLKKGEWIHTHNMKIKEE